MASQVFPCQEELRPHRSVMCFHHTLPSLDWPTTNEGYVCELVVLTVIVEASWVGVGWDFKELRLLMSMPTCLLSMSPNSVF